jgi:hypothetical protein
VLVSGLPETLDTAALRDHFAARFGDVVHVGVSLANRELILAMVPETTIEPHHPWPLLFRCSPSHAPPIFAHPPCPPIILWQDKRAQLLSNVEDAGLALFRSIHVAREGHPPPNGSAARRARGGAAAAAKRAAAKTAAAAEAEAGAKSGEARAAREEMGHVHMQHAVRHERRALDQAVARLHAYDGTVVRLARTRHRCTGLAFVTFNSTAAAKEARLDGGSQPFAGVTIQIREAPPPDQVMCHGAHSALPPTPFSAQCPPTAWHFLPRHSVPSAHRLHGTPSHAIQCPVPTDGVALWVPTDGLTAWHRACC